MAAVIFMKRRQGNASMNHDLGAQDDADDLDNMRPSFEDNTSNQHRLSGDPTTFKMPAQNDVLKKGTLWKFAGKDDWKPMDVALTSDGVYLAKPGEELLREMIPLDEVVDVKKRNNVPESVSENSGIQDIPAQKQLASIKSFTKESNPELENRAQFIVQIRTAEFGYNRLLRFEPLP